MGAGVESVSVGCCGHEQAKGLRIERSDVTGRSEQLPWVRALKGQEPRGRVHPRSQDPSKCASPHVKASVPLYLAILPWERPTWELSQ